MTLFCGHSIRHVNEVHALRLVPHQALNALQAMGSMRALVDGQIFQLHGDPVCHIALVCSGQLVIGLSDIQGRSHIVRPIGAGHFFNLLPVLDHGPAIHSAHASGATELLLFEAHAFCQLLQSQPELREAIHQILYDRNRQLYNELANIALLPLRQRCAQLLQHIMRPSIDGWEVCASQSDLAGMLGYTRPVVNRELRQLAEEGVLNLSYLRIQVVDAQKLRNIALGQMMSSPVAHNS